MYIKTLLKQFILGLTAVSITSAASPNCKKFQASVPDIEVVECIENKKGRVTSINISGLMTEEVIKKIVTLSYLEDLKFYHSSYVDDFDLAPLKKLKKLISIDGDCYRHPKHKTVGSEIRKNSFDNLKSLQKLTIEGCKVMGDQPYAGLTNIRELSIHISRGWSNVPDLTYLKDKEHLTSLTLLNYYTISSREILTNLAELKNLKKLSIRGFIIDQQKLDEISSLEKLEELELSPVDIEDYNVNYDSMINLKDHLQVLIFNRGDGPIPECFFSFKNLKKLELTGFEFLEFPEKITDLVNLEHLQLITSSYKGIPNIPESIKNLSKLEFLDLSNNYIDELPESLGELKKLKDLILENNRLKALPESFINLVNLKYLNLSYNEITSLQDLKLPNLEELYLNCMNINEISSNITKLQSLKKLEISQCSRSHEIDDPSFYLSEIPENIKELKNLENLSLSYQNIKEIPIYIKELKNLKYLDLSHNYITEVSESINELKNLEYLDLSYNDIKELPEFLNTVNIKKVLFNDNENLTGKTLINENIEYCDYDNTKLCIEDEKVKCIRSYAMNLQPCVIVPSDCDEIESFIKENNIDDTDFNCQDEEKKLNYLVIQEESISNELLNKVLTYNSTEEIKITVDNTKNALKKIGQSLPNLKKLTIITKTNSLNLKVLKNLKSLNYLKINSYDILYKLKKGSLRYLTGLKEINITNLNISQTIVDEFEKLVNLEILTFNSCNYPSDVDFDQFEELQKLKKLKIYSYFEGKTPLTTIPSGAYYLKNLQELSITEQKISKISSKISKLKKLKDLNLYGNTIKTLPDALNKLEDLKYVDFGKNPTLTGKTLTNENLRSCSYDNTSSICKAKEMDCFDEEIKLCE